MASTSAPQLKLTLTCRICLEQSKLSDLVNPCRCNGTLKYIHKSCFVSWIDKSKSLTCELCRSYYRDIIVRSKPAGLLAFIRAEPEWAISFAINSIPLIYDVYSIVNQNRFSFCKSRPEGGLEESSPVTIKLNTVNMSLYFSLDKLNFGLKSIPITLPIELLNLYFFVRDMCCRFREFKRLNRSIDVDFI